MSAYMREFLEVWKLLRVRAPDAYHPPAASREISTMASSSGTCQVHTARWQERGEVTQFVLKGCSWSMVVLGGGGGFQSWFTTLSLELSWIW